MKSKQSLLSIQAAKSEEETKVENLQWWAGTYLLIAVIIMGALTVWMITGSVMMMIWKLSHFPIPGLGWGFIVGIITMIFCRQRMVKCNKEIDNLMDTSIRFRKYSPPPPSKEGK